MTTPLSEAGRLYLQDIDVLEEARDELDAYFKQVWDAFSVAVPLAGKASFDHAGRTWSGWAKSIGRSLYFSTPGVTMQLGVCDPFLNEPKEFGVWLWCNKPERARIERAPGALPKLLEIARVRELKFSFEDINELCAGQLNLRDQEPTAAGQALATMLRAFADHAVALQAPLDTLPTTSSDEAAR